LRYVFARARFEVLVRHYAACSVTQMDSENRSITTLEPSWPQLNGHPVIGTDVIVNLVEKYSRSSGFLRTRSIREILVRRCDGTAESLTCSCVQTGRAAIVQAIDEGCDALEGANSVGHDVVLSNSWV
jgi:hypothetical protein